MFDLSSSKRFYIIFFSNLPGRSVLFQGKAKKSVGILVGRMDLSTLLDFNTQPKPGAFSSGSMLFSFLFSSYASASGLIQVLFKSYSSLIQVLFKIGKT